MQKRHICVREYLSKDDITLMAGTSDGVITLPVILHDPCFQVHVPTQHLRLE